MKFRLKFIKIKTKTTNLNENLQNPEIYFAKKGVLVRGMSAYNLSNYLRVSLGTKKENKIVIEILKTFLRDFK